MRSNLALQADKFGDPLSTAWNSIKHLIDGRIAK